MSGPLSELRLVNLGVNLPPAAAAARLHGLGMSVTKVEPPAGDPMAVACPSLYALLSAGQDVARLDLKEEAGRAKLENILTAGDVLLTASRPAALERLGLAWDELAARHRHLVQVAIVGRAAPLQHVAGHDLTYVARVGLLAPPSLPRTLVADLGGAERAVSTALALLLGRDSEGAQRYAEVALEESAAFFALPLEHGLTTAEGVLGGGYPLYGVYEAKDGWVGVAALEPHFRQRLLAELGLASGERTELAAVFRTRTPQEWESWAAEHDLPLAAVSDPRLPAPRAASA